MLTLSSEPKNATERTIHSKTYQKGMAVLTILLSAAALFAFPYFTPD